MFVRTSIVCLLATSGFALGQSQTRVFTQDNNEPAAPGEGWLATAPHVAVGGNSVVVAANRRLAIFDKSSNLLELRDIGSSSQVYPFLIDPDHEDPRGAPILFDPQAGYDPIANRSWLLYIEGVGTIDGYFTTMKDGTPGLGKIAYLHLGVSKDPDDFPTPGGPLITFDDTHWWYYTHDAGTGTKAGPAFDLNDKDNLLRYKGEGIDRHPVPDATVRLASIAFDEQAIMVTPNKTGVTTNDEIPASLFLHNAFGHTQYVYIIPREHAGGSILDGDRPAENEITIINLSTFPLFGDPRRPDGSDFIRAVQEPFPNGSQSVEQVENATFFINVGLKPDSSENTIRLRGIFDADPSPTSTDWTLQQQLDPDFPERLLDMSVLPELKFYEPTNFFGIDQLPRTPDQGSPMRDAWEPHALGSQFHTAVLVKDVNNNFRIFAAHAVHPSESGFPTTQWVVQWYVIDPKIADFGSATPTDWQPSIVAQGRIENEGDAYHPVMVVNRQGVASIDYTYSDETTYPQIRRVRLDSTYTGIVGSEQVVKVGSGIPYVPAAQFTGYWADYADAQADPFDQCFYWSTHTLVFAPPNQDPPLNDTEKRDVWLFQQPFNTTCFQTQGMLDLNDDGVVDTFDLAALTDLYARSARRIDLNADGVTDRHDLDLYMAAYDEYTRQH